MAYSVRESGAPAVADALVNLWRRNLPAAAADLDAKLRWFYCDAPSGPARVMLLHHDESPIGCAGIGVRRFWIESHAAMAPVGLLADLAVDRTHRTAFPALTLTRATRDAARRVAPLHYGFPNASAVALFERMGYRKLGVMTRWVRILRHAEYIEREVRNRALARTAGALMDGLRLLQVMPARLASLPLRLEKVGTPRRPVDERFDRLWEVGRHRFGIVAWRGADQLRWRFHDAPERQVELIALVERHGAALRAYAAVERVGSVYHVRDVFGVGLADTGLLLDHLVPVLRQLGATALSFSFLGSPQVEEMLRAHRFVPRESTRAVVVDARPGEDIPGVEAWYLTDGDEDNL